MSVHYFDWVRRLNYRSSQVFFYLSYTLNPHIDDFDFDRYESAVYDHARALWSIALRMSAADREEYLERMKYDH